MNGSIGLYYQNHKICIWIKKSYKVNKALITEFVLFVSVITCVTVMTTKIVLVQNPSDQEGSCSDKINLRK